jgi:NADH:ubiquinone oxidoreductase subunit D
MQYNQSVPYTDRLDYLAPLANNVAYALAVEKLMSWELPPRGKSCSRDLLRTRPHFHASDGSGRDNGVSLYF